ncbi:rsuA, partial [Symbiodinium sp. KB8]
MRGMSVAASPFLKELLEPVSEMRADNLLKQYGLAERRSARSFLRKHQVLEQSDGQAAPSRVLTAATKVNPAHVTVDGEPLPFTQPLHLAMYKPAGVSCTHAEDEGPTVFDMLPGMFQLRKPRLQCVGRLDRATTGLLLFTQSGQLNHRITAPSKGMAKVYKVRTAAPLCASGREAAAFASGALTLEDGSVCRPATLTPHPADPHWCQVTLHQGMYHQVRRMFAAVGHAVVALHRSAVGPLSLEGMGLLPGDWRPLQHSELAALARATDSSTALPPTTFRRLSIAEAAAGVLASD